MSAATTVARTARIALELGVLSGLRGFRGFILIVG
jgi:hypothetical protein